MDTQITRTTWLPTVRKGLCSSLEQSCKGIVFIGWLVCGMCFIMLATALGSRNINDSCSVIDVYFYSCTLAFGIPAMLYIGLYLTASILFYKGINKGDPTKMNLFLGVLYLNAITSVHVYAYVTFGGSKGYLNVLHSLALLLIMVLSVYSLCCVKSLYEKIQDAAAQRVYLSSEHATIGPVQDKKVGDTSMPTAASV